MQTVSRTDGTNGGLAVRRDDHGRVLPGTDLGAASRFQPGNRAAARHGATSPTVLAERTVELLDALNRALADDVGAGERYSAARLAWARAAARVELLTSYLSDAGLLNSKGNPRPALRSLEAAESALARWCAALGLDPTSAAKLGVTIGKGRALTVAERIAAEMAERRQDADSRP
jgi:hypothetical protein